MFKPILAIETSEKLCSAAVMLNEDDFFELNIQKKNIHSEKLMEMISLLFTQSETYIDDLAHIAVSIGPGSFTGLRIGLSVAKGLALGKDLAIVPVPNFEALALQISKLLPNSSEFTVANRANMSELYVGRYRSIEKEYETIEEAKLVEIREFESRVDDTTLLFGNYRRNFEIASPNAISVAKWSYIYGEDLVTYEHDFLEPNYLKKFIVKVKK